VRDFVLGARLLDGRGEVLTFGGSVMKNVAGYDLARLLVGSLGILGVILEVSVKVLPKPAVQLSLTFELEEQESLDRLNAWAGQPLPLSASVWHEGVLSVRLAGSRAAVTDARGRLGGELMEASGADAFWTGIREQTHPFFASGPSGASLWRLSVKSTAPYADLSGEQLVEWGGALRWLVGARGDAARLRAWAQGHGGHATLFRGFDKAAGVFHPLPPAMLAVQRRLKAEFDPHGVLNRGRMYASF
jgi:glycolate oxidase FAD binding subunit